MQYNNLHNDTDLFFPNYTQELLFQRGVFMYRLQTSWKYLFIGGGNVFFDLV